MVRDQRGRGEPRRAIAQAKQDGGKILTGGGSPTASRPRLFVEPTVIDGLPT
jgi:acyl-CoA reductase-like NAD-dependent aldehyde dehydrogenase